MATDRLRLTRPDDWHLHLRDGPLLASVVGDTARQFARAVIMPNLAEPVIDADQARAYRERILAAVPPGRDFEPLMTLYLTEQTRPQDIRSATQGGLVHAVKYYPAGATTHAARGVRDLERTFPVLEEMQRLRVPLLMHGEVTDPAVDVFDREAVFIDRELVRLLREFPDLPMVLEHITTRQAVEFVRSAPEQLAATITAHHLQLNRNALFDGGLRPHHYCLPLIKRETHRQALIEAATSGHPRFFLGTDSAPHPRGAKESACGCAGIYTARNALEFYAEIFDAAGALDRLEAFAAFHGADFYRLPRNTGFIELERARTEIPAQIDFGGEPGVPLRAGGHIDWRLIDAGDG